MKFIQAFHGKTIFSRRVNVLSNRLAELIPENADVLDVGCGDGSIAHAILRLRPDVTVRGIDVLLRPVTKIEVMPFDGMTFPFEDNTFDVVMFVDVLHHTDEPGRLLSEALRVSRGHVLLKDHCNDGLLAQQTLRLMDWVGNASHGVSLPYNYWSEQHWREVLHRLGMKEEDWTNELGLYPFPLSLFFDRGLHFVSLLRIGD